MATHTKPFRIAVFEYNGSGQKKINGIKQYGIGIEISEIVNIVSPLPEFIDNPETFLPDTIDADLVLCFLKHPDLCFYLAKVCKQLHIPMIASGTKTEDAITPFTCCGLGKLKNIGAYGVQFGVPEYSVKVKDNIITDIQVNRGASCGATWEIIDKVVGLTVEDALHTLPREVQYVCIADPSAFDPISGKSSLHYAGNVHIAALKKALHEAGIPVE